ncbi:Poly-beta-1,6-N-acetyl-D-glucosamine synthase [compost metagenome]
MMVLFQILLLLLVLALLVPVAVLVLQVWSASRATPLAALPDGPRPEVAVLVPAHNEAAGIAATVAGIREQLQAGDRILVVADNCDDETAELALAAGAPVLEREDLGARGKGYALDAGVRQLALNPPQVLIIIDADCRLTPDTITHLAHRAQQTQRPVQALDLMRAPRTAGLKIRIAEFAWIVKNKVRALGFHHLGLPCQLMGTGMAFPWPLIAQASLANGHLAEDMQLGIELARAQAAPVFCPEACVTSYFPSSDEAARMQRTRWEHGHMGMIISQGLPLLWQGIRERDRALFGTALDMCVPPLALLTLLSLALFALTALNYLIFDFAAPLLLATLSLAALTLAILWSWQRFGQQVLSLKDLFSALGYACWKLPLYLKFFVNRQLEWVRARRDAE